MAGKAEPWQYLPNGVLEAAERDEQATAWAAQERAKVADMWAEQQYSELDTLLEQYGYPSARTFLRGYAGPTGAVEDEYFGPGLPPEQPERPGNERLPMSVEEFEALPPTGPLPDSELAGAWADTGEPSPKPAMELPQPPGMTGRMMPRFGETFEQYRERNLPQNLGEAAQFAAEDVMSRPRPSISPQGVSMIDPRLGDNPLENPPVGGVLGMADDLPMRSGISRAAESDIPAPAPRGGVGRVSQSANPANQTLGKMYEEAAKVSKAPGLPERLEEARKAFVRAWTDRGVDLSEFQKAAEKAKGRPLDMDEMASEIRRLNPDKAAEVKLQEGLQPAVRAVGDDLDWLNAYLTHQDNIDVAAAMGNEARRFSGGLSVADSQRALADMPNELGQARFEKIEQAAQQVYEFSDAMRQRMVDAGVWSPELADTLRQRYPHYVPTRILDYLKEPERIPHGQKLGLNDKGLRANTLEGTTRAREMPLASLVRAAYDVEQMARRNEAFNAFLKLRDLIPDGDKLIRQVADSYTPTRGEARLTGFVNGQRVSYVVPKEIEAVIKNEAQAVIPGLSQAMNVFRALATSRNPLFLSANALNDAYTYMVRESSRAGGPQNLPKVMTELGRAYIDAFGGLFTGTYRGDTARFLREGGGMFGFFQGSEQGARKAVEDLARSNAIEVKNLGDLRRVLGDVLTLKPLEAIGERIELAPRVASMRLAERRGANQVQAVIAGRDVTVDFARGGDVSKILNQFVPFFNVGVQAATQPVRAFRENPAGFVSSAIALLAGPAVAAEAWNRSDPQRATDYDDVPDYIKEQGVVVMLPGEAPVDANGNRRPQFLLIKTREYSPIVTLTREAAARALGDDPRGWGELIGETIGGISPVEGIGAGGVDVSRAVDAVTPLGLSTAAQLGFNKDAFRGSTIATEQNDERATAFSKFLADALGARPSQVEFGLRDLLPGVGGLALDATELVAGRKREPSGAAQDIPIVGKAISRFVRGDVGQRLQEARDATLSPEVRNILKGAGLDTDVGPLRREQRGVTLRLEEQAQLQALTNQKIDEQVREAVADPRWETEDQQTRERVIRRAIDRARQQAWAEFVTEGIPEEEFYARRRQNLERKAG